jgi:predicted nucleotidyltransferase
MDAEKLLQLFVNQATDTFGSTLKSITLVGSYAREEATPSSDIDLYCIFDKLSGEDLASMGRIVRSLPIPYEKLELNTQCLTVDEFANQGFEQHFVKRPVLYFEGKVLYGTSFAAKPSATEIKSFICELLANSIMSTRHYLTVLESKEKLATGKLRVWSLKPFIAALRLERYLACGTYPLTYTDLLRLSEGTPPSVAVRWMKEPETFNSAILDDSNAVLIQLLDLSTELSDKVNFPF